MMPAFPALVENPRDFELIGLVLGLVFWVQMIRLCATREAPSLERNLWLAFIIFVPGIGSLLYFFLRLPRLRA